ncbi:MAG TPA: MMPL family transporter [Mycobacteriales bacterium]|jgi:RND superfamily putative drug exporter|nr:MMPL family transporter [Mycobacteriales bacterium]
MLVRIADWCYTRRRLVVVLWIAALIATLGLSSAFGGSFRADYMAPGSESKAVVDLLKEKFPQRSGDTLRVVFKADGPVTAEATKARIETILGDISKREHVAGVTSPFSAEGAAQVSRQDPSVAYAEVNLDKIDTEFTPETAKELVLPILDTAGQGLQVEAGGAVAAMAQAPEIGSEGIGFIAAAIILLVTFGSVVAMGLPLMTALFGIGIAVALGTLLRHVVPVPDWAPNVAQMIGIGVGIDYALFIVTRYRGSLADGADPRRATLTAIATAGRAVVFAGITVVISMLGMLLMNQPFTAGVALSAVIAVLVIMLASVTLLPAVLGFTGRNIERLHVPFVAKTQKAFDKTLFYKWSRFIQHRPWSAAVAGLAALLALSAPFLGIRFGFPDSGNDDKSVTSRKAYDLLAAGFGPGFNGPMVLAVQGGTGEALLAPANVLAEKLKTVPGVAFVSPAQPAPGGDTAVITLVPVTSPQDKATEDLVDSLRDDAIPAAIAGTPLEVNVGGIVPGGIDSTRSISSRLPIFIGAVVLLSFLLLMMVFRSVLVPLKAAVMNLLSITAALGVMALAVNGGPLGDLIGIPDPTPVPSFIPMMMFAILFGLSMDYEVFLLSRIREEYDKSHDNSSAVADGLAKTARVITAAAAIMITVFLAFVPIPMVFMKMIGIGLAAAILVDATIVRMVLVPATMELLGDRNWWLPAWLDRLLPKISVEGHELTDAEIDLTDKVVKPRKASDQLAGTEG